MCVIFGWVSAIARRLHTGPVSSRYSVISFFGELQYLLQPPVHTESLQESKAKIIKNSEKLVNQQFTTKYNIVITAVLQLI